MKYIVSFESKRSIFPLFLITYLNFLSAFFVAVSMSSIQILAVRSKIPLQLYLVKQNLSAFSISPLYDFFNLISPLSLINSKLCLQVFLAQIFVRVWPSGQFFSSIGDALPMWISFPKVLFSIFVSLSSSDGSLSQNLMIKESGMSYLFDIMASAFPVWL